MKRLKITIFIVSALFLTSTSFAETCSDRPDAAEASACDNYFGLQGQWQVTFTKVRDDCARRVRFPSSKKIKVKISTEELWYADSYHSDLFDLDVEDSETANFVFIKGSRWLLPYIFVQQTEEPDQFGISYTVEASCGLLYYCTRYDDFTFKYSNARSTRFTGTATFTYTSFDNTVCRARYKLKGQFLKKL